MSTPKIIKAINSDLIKVKGVLKLGFASDALLRWIFPDASKYLKSFDLWMEEFSKIAFANNLVYIEENFYGSALWHPPGAQSFGRPGSRSCGNNAPRAPRTPARPRRGSAPPTSDR